MVAAVADAITDERHLMIVQAGTGTGKSLAYLVPAALSARLARGRGHRHQGAPGPARQQGPPFLAGHLDRAGHLRPAEGAVELPLPPAGARSSTPIRASWASTTPTTGSRTGTSTGSSPPGGPTAPRPAIGPELEFEPRSPPGPRAVMRGPPRGAPGAAGAEAATRLLRRAGPPRRRRGRRSWSAHSAGTHLDPAAAVLPEHHVVVFDEAHQLGDVISATSGFDSAAGAFRPLARTVGAIVDDPIPGRRPRRRRRPPHHRPRPARSTGASEPRRGRARARRRPRGGAHPPGGGAGGPAQRCRPTGRATSPPPRKRAVKATTSLADDVDAVMDVPLTHVAWVAGPEATRRQGRADRRGRGHSANACGRTAPRCSPAPPSPVARPAPGPRRGRGHPARRGQSLRAFGTTACSTAPPTCPSPCSAASTRAAMVDELVGSSRRGGPHPLVLFTSWRVMEAAATAATAPVHPGDDLARPVRPPALVRRFTDEPETSLFATMGFWRASTSPARPSASSPSTACRSAPRQAPPPGPAGRARAGDVPAHQPAPGRHPPGPGRRPLIRPPTTAAWWPCSTPPRHRLLPVGLRPGPAADAAHPRWRGEVRANHLRLAAGLGDAGRDAAPAQ